MHEHSNRGDVRLICLEQESVNTPESPMNNMTLSRRVVGDRFLNCLVEAFDPIGQFGAIRLLKITNQPGIHTNIIPLKLLNNLSKKTKPLDQRTIVEDNNEIARSFFSKEINKKFEIHSYRNAASILATGFPKQFEEICSALAKFEISKTMIRLPGENKGPIAKYVDELFDERWMETRISADLHVKLTPVKKADQKKFDPQFYIREGILDGHRIDFVKGKVALDLEWNSKDQTYDRDLYAFSAFYDAGAIDVGVILTRGKSLDTNYFRTLGKVLTKELEEGPKETYEKFGASTTWMGKLLPRLDAGRNGGCPVLAIGITPNCVTE